MKKEQTAELEKELAEVIEKLSDQNEIVDQAEDVGSVWKYDEDYLHELEEEVEELQYRISVLKARKTYEEYYSSYQELLRDALIKHEVKVSEDGMTVTGEIPLDVQYVERIPELSKHRDKLFSYEHDDLIMFKCSIEFSNTDMLQNATIRLIATSPYCKDFPIVLDSLPYKHIEEIAKNVCEKVEN